MRTDHYKYNWQNQQRMMFDGCGKYDIPEILPTAVDVSGCRWIGFNYAMTEKRPEECVCHFYLDDYQFERLWNYPDRYINLLSRFKAIASPDFSMYTDYPRAIQIYNHFRKHWLAAFYQAHGINVIPTICWGNPDTYDFCFDGDPKKSIITLSDFGCQKTRAERKAFQDGLEKTIAELNPSIIYLYTARSTELETGFNNVRIETVKNSRIIELRKHVKGT